MRKDTIVVGLDIGTTKCCAIVGKLNEFGQINILGIGKAPCTGVRRGVVINIEKTVASIQAAVAEAEKHADVDIQKVHVGIAGEHIRSMTQRSIVTLSESNQEITETEVRRLRDDTFRTPTPPGTEIIHVIPQDYMLDNEPGVKDPIGMSGVRLEGHFHVVTAQSTSARNIYTCVRRANLEARELILQPLASSYAVLSEEEKEAGVCLVDIGGGTTDIAIFKDSIIRHTAVIPIGGNTLTEDIKTGCGIMHKYAEKLKTSYGCAMAKDSIDDEILSIHHLKGRAAKEISKRTLARIIQARMEELFELVLYQIHEHGYLKSLTGGIVVTGGGAQLEYLAELVEYVTGLDARIGYPREMLAQGLVDEVMNPIYATGVGLVMYGLMHETEPYTTTRTGYDATYGAGPQTPKPQSFTQRLKDWFERTLYNASNIID